MLPRQQCLSRYHGDPDAASHSGGCRSSGGYDDDGGVRAERLKIERGHCIKKQRWREGWMEEGHKRRKMMVSWGHPQTEERKGRRAVIRKGVIII